MNKEPDGYNCNVVDILTLIESHTKHKIFIAGDFNFNFASNHHGYILFKELVRDYKLKFCDTLTDSTDSNIFTLLSCFS